MNNFIKKTILGTITLGLLLSTVFGPLFSNKAYADAAYAFSAISATESTLNFQVLVQVADPADLQGINPLEIEYSINQDYSASQTVAVPDFDTVQLNQNRIAIAGGLTPSTTYYARLLNSASLSLKETTAQTSAPGTTTQDPTSGASTESSVLPPCMLLSAETWGGCVARIIYFIFFVPTSFLFSLSGQLMDFSMAYTLNSANYGKTADGSSFVEKGWTITRDLSNLLFIVMLMYIAINIILGKGADKKLLGTIILVGLLINFSLFFARVVIDASNILGKIFYDNMGIETNNEAYINNPWIGEGDKSISIAIVSNFNPQKLFSQVGTLKLNTTSGVQDTGAVDAGPFIIITLVMSVINLFGMYIFFVVAFVLIGRVIGLWLLMIFAPIAFISHIMPASASGVLNKMHHSKWWPELFKQSFVVPIFLFLLYLILLFVNTGFLKGFKTFDNTTTGGILDVIVPLIIITFLLKAAKDIATEMSGDIGKAFASVGSTVGGLALGGVGGLYGKALGGALGGVAGAGRATAGRLGQKLAESKLASNLANSNSAVGRSLGSGLKTVGNTVGSASFDVRAIKQVQKATDKYVPLGKSKTGGFIQDSKDQQKKWEDKSKEISKVHRSEAEIKAVTSAKIALENKKNSKITLGGKEQTIRDFELEYKETIEKKQKDLATLKSQGQEKGDADFDKTVIEIATAKEKLTRLKKTQFETEETAVRDAEKEVKKLENKRLSKFAERVESGVVTQNDGFLTSGWKRLKGSAPGSLYVGMSNTARAEAAENIRKGLKAKEEKEAKEEGKK